MLYALQFIFKNSGADWWWSLTALVSVLITSIFYLHCIDKNHKPDWGYPEEEKINLGGMAHLVYFCFYVWLAMTVIVNDVLSYTSWFKTEIIVFLLGGTIYLLTFWRDVHLGHFNPIEKE